MNISFVIMVDEEQIVPNNELQTTIGEIITSYIRQTLGGKKVAGKIRKGGTGHGPRPQWSDEQITKLKEQHFALSADESIKPAEIWRRIAPMINKSPAAVQLKWTQLKKKGLA